MTNISSTYVFYHKYVEPTLDLATHASCLGEAAVTHHVCIFVQIKPLSETRKVKRQNRSLNRILLRELWRVRLLSRISHIPLV